MRAERSSYAKRWFTRGRSQHSCLLELWAEYMQKVCCSRTTAMSSLRRMPSCGRSARNWLSSKPSRFHSPPPHRQFIGVVQTQKLAEEAMKRRRDCRRQILSLRFPLESQIVPRAFHRQQLRFRWNQLDRRFDPNGSRVPWTNKARVCNLGRC